MYNLYYFLFEFGVIVTVFLILWRERKNKQMLETLILAFVFGMVLEIIDSTLSKAYFYSKDFLFMVSNIPIVIGTGWAFVYYTTKKVAGHYNFKWFQAPFFMALVAVLIDFILDPIAIRLGFWTWRIPLNQELLGVPYDNFVGWLAAIWTFAFLINLSERKFLKESTSKIIKYISVIIAPILLSLQITFYLIISALFSGKFSFQEIMEFYRIEDYSYAYQPEVQIWKFYIFFLIIFVLAVYSVKNIISQRKFVH